MRPAQGFTLLEVMIALAIFALCASVLLEQSNRSLRQQHELELRTLARWVADNQLSELQLRAAWMPPGVVEGEVAMANQSWYVETRVTATADPDLARVDVAVALAQARPAVLSRLTGFVGRH